MPGGIVVEPDQGIDAAPCIWLFLPMPTNSPFFGPPACRDAKRADVQGPALQGLGGRLYC